MTRCPVCQTPLQGPTSFCPACGISRPGARGGTTQAPRSRVGPSSRETVPPPVGGAVGAAKLPPLAACVIMDVLGMATYMLPFWGEMADVVWAPLSGFAFYLLFRNTPGVNGTLGALVATAEEALPMTDAFPTFTVAWIMAYLSGRRNDTSR